MQVMMLLFFMPLFLVSVRNLLFDFLLLLDNNFSLFWLLYVMIVNFWVDYLLLKVGRLIKVCIISFNVVIRLWLRNLVKVSLHLLLLLYLNQHFLRLLYHIIGYFYYFRLLNFDRQGSYHILWRWNIYYHRLLLNNRRISIRNRMILHPCCLCRLNNLLNWSISKRNIAAKLYNRSSWNNRN